MGHEFEVSLDADVDATVDEVWQAIATGPGIDSWYMGHNEVAGGEVRTVFGQYTPVAPIFAEEPGKRFAYGAPPEPDGRFLAYDFLVEARAGGGASIRVVTSGFLPGDDWADEFEAMTKGGAMVFRTLVEYVNHFANRTATPVLAFGPPITDWDRAWAALGAAFGLDRPVREGDRVRLSPDGAQAVEGVAYFVNDHVACVRTNDAMYRMVRGFQGPMLAMHQLFAPGVDAAEAGRTWQAWLARVFG
ncbi:SRPBCC domain-containing protein [Rugosimonospora acidiphila]|uniref:SRPBCC domain-containing protein n=1 Tax=Rugosimonospora acidiphila TaxID=556531 RepID=A0ABP9RWQ6_9ACTN